MSTGISLQGSWCGGTSSLTDGKILKWGIICFLYVSPILIWAKIKMECQEHIMPSIVELCLGCMASYGWIQLFLFPWDILDGFPGKNHIKAVLGKLFQEYSMGMF